MEIINLQLLQPNNNLVINAGTFDIAAGDDGLHADATLTVNGGNINISKAYEGIESENIAITNCEISLTSGDDGINASNNSEAADANGGANQNNKEVARTGILKINFKKGGFSIVYFLLF